MNVTLRRLALLISGAVRNAMFVGFTTSFIAASYLRSEHTGLRDEEQRADRMAGQAVENRNALGIHHGAGRDRLGHCIRLSRSNNAAAAGATGFR